MTQLDAAKMGSNIFPTCSMMRNLFSPPKYHSPGEGGEKTIANNNNNNNTPTSNKKEGDSISSSKNAANDFIMIVKTITQPLFKNRTISLHVILMNHHCHPFSQSIFLRWKF